MKILYIFIYISFSIHSFFRLPYFSLKNASALEDSGTFSLKMMAGGVVKENRELLASVNLGRQDKGLFEERKKFSKRRQANLDLRKEKPDSQSESGFDLFVYGDYL